MNSVLFKQKREVRAGLGEDDHMWSVIDHAGREIQSVRGLSALLTYWDLAGLLSFTENKNNVVLLMSFLGNLDQCYFLRV